MWPLDFLILESKNAKNDDLKKEVMTRKKKTSCFGGFCSNLWVKLASKMMKNSGNSNLIF